MPPRLILSTAFRRWQCPQCTARGFASSAPLSAFGPEHPRYIEVPEPPQQTAPYRPFIKGRLPVPREVLRGKDWRHPDAASLDKTTPHPQQKRAAQPGSREEWKQKMSEVRRRNLREGLQALRSRKIRRETRDEERQQRNDMERAELRARPEREDERLTAASHGLDLDKLLHGPLEDPTREARLAHKARNLEMHDSAKRAERLDHLHNLYMNARTFIVTPEQLNEAIEEEFNKDFSQALGGYVGQQDSEATSMWTHGPPMTVQEMLNRASRQGTATGSSRSRMSLTAEVNRERIRKIAEKLTGGKMEDVAK